MASVEEDHHPVFNDEDLDDDDLSGSPHNDVIVDDDDDDVDDDDVSSPSPLPVSSAGQVTIAVVGIPAVTKRDDFTVAPSVKKPTLFQRLWTDEDEIELLQGFLDYTTHRGGAGHHDTAAFYDQIKSKLQLHFNKNQLVEKLRRLKKKYRNVVSKMGSGKEFVFKSSHDQATFEISRKIWSNVGPVVDDVDSHFNLNANLIDHSPSYNNSSFHHNHNGMDMRTPKSRKRPRTGPVVNEKHGYMQQFYQPVILPMPAPAPAPAPMPTPVSIAAPQAQNQAQHTASASASPVAASSIPNLIEETVKSCLSPIFKELLNNVTNLNGPRSLMSPISPIPLGFGGGAMSVDMMADEKWRKQQMLELEVYSRRLELVQDQIKAQLEELRSTTG